MVDVKRADPDAVLGDGGVTRAVVAHENDVVVEVDSIVLGEGAAAAEQVEHLHGEDVLDLILAGDADTARGEHGCAENDGTHGVFVGGAARALLVVGEHVETLCLDKFVERHSSTRSAV